MKDFGYRRREHPRQAVRIEAKIVYPDLSRCIDCILQDVSEGGALINVRGHATVPDRIYLWQPTAQALVECEVRWRKLSLVGLQFTEKTGLKRLFAAAADTSVVKPDDISERRGF